MPQELGGAALLQAQGLSGVASNGSAEFEGAGRAMCRSCETALPPLTPLGLCDACERMFKAVQPALLGGGKAARVARSARVAGRYEFIEVCGQGAMGQVWKVHDKKLARSVALKHIREEHASEPAFIERLTAEAIAADRGGVVIYDTGVDEAIGHYYTMELIEGKHLGELLEHCALRPIHAARYMFAVALQLASAHASDTLHRDVKPANILVDRHDQARLVDFGLASAMKKERVDSVGSPRAGTPCYMAPEQVSGGTVDARTDIYNFGATLYHALTGRPPFQVDTESELFPLIENAEPARPRELDAGIPRDLEAITCCCLAKDPGQRYQSADALAEDLRLFLRGYPIRARPRSRVREAWSWLRRSPTRALLVAVLVLGSALLGATVLQTRADIDRANALAASAIAAVLEPRVRIWKWHLEVGAADPALVAAFAADPTERQPAAQRWLDDWCARGGLPSGTATLLDRDGVALARCPRDPHYVGTSLRLRDYYQGALRSRTLHVSNTYASMIDQRLRFALSIPVFGAEREILGILAVGCDAGEAMGISRLALGDRRVTVQNPLERGGPSAALEGEKPLAPLWSAGSVSGRNWLTLSAKSPIAGTRAEVVVQSPNWIVGGGCVVLAIVGSIGFAMLVGVLWRKRRRANLESLLQRLPEEPWCP